MSDPIEISQVGNDVLGAGVSGDQNVIAKHVTTVQGNFIQLINASPEAIAALKKIDAMPTNVAPGGAGGMHNTSTPKDADALQGSIDELLRLLKTTNQSGQSPKEIQGGGVQISRGDLLLKKAILLKTEADQMYFEHLQRNQPRIDQAKKVGGPNYQFNLPEIFKDFDRGKHTAKLREAYELLQEANQHDPTDTEVLLYMAQLLIDLTPDDPTDEQRLLYRVQSLLSSPKDDTERFRLAQAIFLLATSANPVQVESLRDARQMFEKLERREWVRHCDQLLNSIAQQPATQQYNQPPPIQPPRTQTRQNFSGPPPVLTGFQPVGRWQFQITDAARSTMVVDFFPNGTFTAMQHSGAFGTNIQAQGQWLFNPYQHTLQFQGLTGNYMPFALGITIQQPHLNGFYGFGSDYCAYFITRM